MTRGCFSYSMILMSVGEPSATLGEAGQPSGKLRAESGQVVTPKPVDSDHHYEGGVLRSGSLGGCEFAAKSERGKQKKGSRHTPI